MQHMKRKDKVTHKVDIHGEGMSDKTVGGILVFVGNSWWKCAIYEKIHSIPVLPSCQLCIM